MNSDTARGLVVYLPSFKENDTIVISCNNVGLQSLVQDFVSLPTRNAAGTAQFVIGERPPIISDGHCIVTVVIRNRQPMRVSRQRAELFMWEMDWGDHAEVVQKLRVMSEYGRPCHQYFESAEISVPYPIILVSLLEYDNDRLLRMKEDDRSGMTLSVEIQSYQRDP